MPYLDVFGKKSSRVHLWDPPRLRDDAAPAMVAEEKAVGWLELF